jgi:hypothetical protein
MTKNKKQSSQPEGWEMKDRHYYLTGNKSPLTYTIPSRHSERVPLLWFDEEKGEQRALRYATNQASPLVDEQKGEVTLKHIVFRDGTLRVPRQQQALQKMLSIYHPWKDLKYQEYQAVKEAKDELAAIEIELMALNAAKEIEIEHAEAILRVEFGSNVTSLTSKEVRRDILVFAKKQPKTFLALVQDENVELRNIGIKAVEQGIIKLDNKNKDFVWASNGKKLMKVPFDEQPYSAFAAFLKTDEGVEVFKSIEKKLV